MDALKGTIATVTPAGDGLNLQVDARTAERLKVLAESACVTLDSLVGDALDFYLDGCGA